MSSSTNGAPVQSIDQNCAVLGADWAGAIDTKRARDKRMRAIRT